MTNDTARQDSWESTLPHFSTVEKHGAITVPASPPSETLRFFAILTFVLWALVAVGAAFWFHSMQTHNPSPWLGVASIVGSFLPAILASIVADEARDTFGQRSTGNWIAWIPALSGVAVGLLGTAVWFRDFTGGVLAVLSAACSAGAAISTFAAWRGIRYTRRRQDWLTALRRHGVRSPGELRNVKFLKRWTADDPQFTVTVAFDAPTGRRVVTANMVAHHSRVPLAGSRVVVFSAPHDTDDVLIELDPANPPKFDRDPSGQYCKPSGN
ncbi:hypothetical protein [Mycolicibacterium setense]|uniref:DUF3592 domain-containing protein n=1 Tax=Mycolicibacterium setense TaxID=431269 RepID=A0ABR4YVK7_9MYCO|nr:hypothetical protein [Mycolicibacterium setense]KHO21729.1 hypothetical protein QQ25_14500 [Mycolicibacterium setense]KHO26261.1 hypothetical protein QQ44_11025 [Mycolicibacterium setense]MCV7114126.1 hypothetical protein [Mycolicibacterium setense]